MRYVLDVMFEPKKLAEQCNKWGEDEHAVCPVGCPSAVPCPFSKPSCDEITETDWEALLYADFRLD